MRGRVKPWMIPLLYEAYRRRATSPSELGRQIGVKSRLIKKALQALGTPLTEDVAARLQLQNVVVRGRKYVWREGKNYVLARVGKRIAVYHVPIDIVELVKRYRGKERVGIKETANALGLPPLLVSRALQVLRILESREYVKDPEQC